MDRWDWLLVVASVVLGQFALLGIEGLRSTLDRRKRRQDRRDDFQHETLTEIQEAMVAISNAIGKIVHQVMTDSEITQDNLGVHREAEARYWVLSFRVTDDVTQAACKQYIGSTRKILDEAIMKPTISKEAVKSAFDDAGWRFSDAQKAVGERLRML